MLLALILLTACLSLSFLMGQPMATNPTREPAMYAEVARLVIAALVALGWVTVDDNTANTIVTLVGGILSVVLTVVVPTSRPFEQGPFRRPRETDRQP
jgi:hypothetical protein